MPRKNIVEITYNWPAETFIQRHIQALRMADFPIRVVARHAHFVLSESASLAEMDESISAGVMPNFNHLSRASKLTALHFLTARSLRSRGLMLSDKVLLGYFERLRPDLIHFHDASLAASMAWIPASLGIPYTMSVRGSDVQVLPLQSAAQKAAVISALEGAAHIHAVCHALKRRAAELVGRDLDISVIYTTLPIPSELPAWQGVRAGEPVHFISSGRLMWRKGLPDLLTAIRSLRDRGMDARLTLIGSGPELDHLLYLRKMLQLESFVSLPGKLNHQQIQNLFRTAHAYIQSSVAEGLSNSLVEAMAGGLPVFATDVDGTNEAVEDGVSGFLLPPLAPQDWAAQLTRIHDTLLMERIRKAAYKKAAQLFSRERHARAFISFFEKRESDG